MSLAPYIIDGIVIERIDADPVNAPLERLLMALDHYNRLDITDDGSVGAARDLIRAQNVLLDACVECGMDHSEDEFAWAAERVARWLLAA